MVTLKRRVWSRLIKTAWLLVFVLVLLTALGGCAWIQNWLNPNHVPVAVIIANPISGEAPLEVSFEASQSYDLDGDAISYKWDFGDGRTGQGQTVTHAFASHGNHIVQLTVTDTKGTKGVSSITIIVTLETISDNIGISGGTVSTSQGSSVTVPANTLANGSAVSISELVEPDVKFKPTVEALGNGVLITLLSDSINTTALKNQSLLETPPGIITIRVPLPSNMHAPSPPDVIKGFLLRFTSGDRSTQMVVGMDREGDVAKVSVPVEPIADFASRASCNAPNKAIASANRASYWFSRISVRMFAKSAGHIPPLLYRAESSSDFVPVGFISTVNEASISYTSQDPSIIPIILIHGYKIARADEVAITASSSGTSPGYEDYAQTSWKDFIDYFYEHCHADLKKKLPAGCDFKLYVYRWDTDEGFDKAGTGLARLINGCFGDRPFILIGHSAGGIVARACVEHNQALVNNFPGIITLASPHWGVTGASILLDKSAKELENVVGNSWLKELNRNAKYTGKLITYGGFITNPFRHGVKLGTLWTLVGPGKNDGIVPLYSALAEGYNVKKRHAAYRDYDHGEMLHGKDGSGLFNALCRDLQELAGELALPAGVAGKIIDYNASPREVTVPGNVTLSVTIENTGNVWQHSFYPAVDLRRPSGTIEHLPIGPITLDPGEQGSTSWTYTIDTQGGWDVMFGLWGESTLETCLDYKGWFDNYIIGRLVESAINIAGTWSGIVTQQPDKRFFYKMVLSQEGTTVSGTSRAEWAEDPQYYKITRIEGTIVDGEFICRDTGILEERPRPGTYWCLITRAVLTFTPGLDVDSLSGPYVCVCEADECLPGEIYLERHE